MSDYYLYVGTVSQSEGGCRNIILGDITDMDKPPVALTVPCRALGKYIEERGWDDAEERYINQGFIYDRNLFLQAVVIPGDMPGIPAKVIACADPDTMSSEIVIFGPEELLTEAEPKSMDRAAYSAWLHHRSTFGLRTRNLGHYE